MGSTELAANLFRATQAEEKLRRKKIAGKDNADKAHREVGAKVRRTIRELGGTMPEELPTVESVKKLESKARKTLQDKKNRIKRNRKNEIRPEHPGHPEIWLPCKPTKCVRRPHNSKQ